MSDSAGSASYRPGDWFGIFGGLVTVVLPPSEKARAVAIWALVDEGAGFDEVLDALIADGLRQLPGFVLVSQSDGETTVVIRGAARAEFAVDGETVTVEGSSVTTWAERTLRGVTSMRVEVAEAARAPDLAIGQGLVRVARIDRPAAAPATEVPDEVTPEGVPVLADIEPEAAVDAEPDAQPDAAPEPDETAYFPQLPDPVARTPMSVARLAFSSGEVVDVDRPVVVGRAPVDRRREHDEDVRLVAVVSPQQEISSTHLEVRPGSGADVGFALVTDLGSTNGTVLQHAGLTPEELRPGIAVRLHLGSVIDLGDGVTIRVEAP